jgi:hypothetical protein
MRFKVKQQSSSSKGICAHNKEGCNIHIYFKQVYTSTSIQGLSQTIDTQVKATPKHGMNQQKWKQSEECLGVKENNSSNSKYSSLF